MTKCVLNAVEQASTKMNGLHVFHINACAVPAEKTGLKTRFSLKKKKLFQQHPFNQLAKMTRFDAGLFFRFACNIKKSNV